MPMKSKCHINSTKTVILSLVFFLQIHYSMKSMEVFVINFFFIFDLVLNSLSLSLSHEFEPFLIKCG